MPYVPKYYIEPKDEIREIHFKQALRDVKKELANKFTRNSPLARATQELVNFIEQDHGL